MERVGVERAAWGEGVEGVGMAWGAGDDRVTLMIRVRELEAAVEQLKRQKVGDFAVYLSIY